MAEQNERDIEERVWLTRWRAGDPDAGARLYDRHSASVTRYFNSKVFGGDVSDVVKDLVHTTFLTLQKTHDAVEHSVRAYIYGVAHNELRHHIRTARRDNRRQDRLQQAVDDGTLPSESSASGDLEAAFGEKQAQRLVGKALRRLELDDQVLLELHYWEELPRVEIAAVLGVPEGTMANRIKAARERLATKMVELSPSIAALETSKTYTTWLAELTPHIDVMRQREAEARARGGTPARADAARRASRNSAGRTNSGRKAAP